MGRCAAFGNIVVITPADKLACPPSLFVHIDVFSTLSSMKKAPEKLRFAVIAVDVPVFAVVDGELLALVSPVDRPPHYKNVDGFIGGLIDASETADDAVERHLRDKAALTYLYTEQLYTFSALERDKRNRVISVAYLGLVRPDTARTFSADNARFVPVKQLGRLAYDHNEVLQVALRRLMGKLEYTTIAQFLLPKHFTLTELQTVYEVVLKREFDKRNFRKKILSLDILKETGRMEEGVKHRPAALYQFTSSKLEELPLFA